MAVMLCTAMVIIVISVMGGFLAMMKASVKNLTSDVIVRGDISGLPHYEQLMEKLRAKKDLIQSCTPVVKSYALINWQGRSTPVEVEGVYPQGQDEVIGFRSKLHWKTQDMLDELEHNYGNLDKLSEAERKFYEAKKKQISEHELVDSAMEMKSPGYLGDRPTIVPGVAAGPSPQRNEKGEYLFYGSSVGRRAVLTLLRISRNGQPIEPAVQEFTSVNEFKSGRYEIDSNRVYVHFDLMQKLMRMDAFEETDPETGKPTGKKEAARCSEIMVRAQPGAPLWEVKAAVAACVKEFVEEHNDEAFYPSVITWEEKFGTFIAAVEKEKALLTALFGIISIVAVAMIGVIFYMIVLEKTRDIGVLRALGVSKWGVMSIFLSYGQVVGIVGGTLGVGLAVIVVKNINEIQAMINQGTIWVSGGTAKFQIWDPRIYLFDKIPTDLNPNEVAIIFCIAVVSSVVGSVVPAFLASRLDPVESLRYE